MRSALFLTVCGLGISILVACQPPRKVSSPTPPATTSEVYEKVKFLPVWAPNNSAYRVIRGYFWADAQPKGVGSQIYLHDTRTGYTIEQFTRPDFCPAEKMLTNAEKASLANGRIVLRTVGGTSHGWVKIGSVWVYANTTSKGASALSEILEEYRTRYRRMRGEEPSLRRELGAELEPIVRKYWDYVEFRNLVSPE